MDGALAGDFCRPEKAEGGGGFPYPETALGVARPSGDLSRGAAPTSAC